MKKNFVKNYLICEVHSMDKYWRRINIGKRNNIQRKFDLKTPKEKVGQITTKVSNFHLIIWFKPLWSKFSVCLQWFNSEFSLLSSKLKRQFVEIYCLIMDFCQTNSTSKLNFEMFTWNVQTIWINVETNLWTKEKMRKNRHLF